MRKKIIGVSIFLLILLTVFADIYLRIEYDNGLLTYLERSQGLTHAEREWLDSHGPIIYGADQNAPPLRYLEQKTGQFEGIVVDYLDALSIELGVEIEFEPLLWEDALVALEKGETDICDMYPSESRELVYLFTDTIYNQKSVILTRIDERKINSQVDLSDRVVAVQSGDYAYEYLDANTNDILYVFTDDYMESIDLLLAGKVDAVVGDEPVMAYFVDEMGVKDLCRTADVPLFEMESIFAVSKTEPMLVSILNKGIYNLKRKDTMEKIYQKWYGISAPFIKERYTEKLVFFAMAAGVVLSLFVYLFYSWNRLLVQEVDKRTKELNTSKRNLQTTFDSLNHLMIVIDRDRNIVNENRAFKERFGVFPEKFIEQEKVNQIIGETFAKAEGMQLEMTLDSHIYEIETYPLEFRSNNVHHILVMAKDVTHIRISERQMLQSNKMTAVGHLAAGVAHEIRNPLGVIRNFAYILKNDLTKDAKKKEQSLDIIVSSVEKAGKTIENLLKFSSISANEFINTSMYDFIRDILSLEYNLMKRQNIVTTLECDEALQCKVNQESMKHILINLISNSVEAMPDGGSLTIRCHSDDDTLKLECIDDGAGMDEEQIESIFNPFYTTKQKNGGTGLGLYLTYNEIQKLGGEINVESELGKGTIMRVLIPLRKGDESHG